MEYINKFTSFLNDMFLYSNEETDNTSFEEEKKSIVNNEPVSENENKLLSDEQDKKNKQIID